MEYNAELMKIDLVKLRARRKALKLTQAQLAERVGISTSDVSDLELGRSLDLDTRKSRALADALGIDREEFEAESEGAALRLKAEVNVNPERLKAARLEARLSQADLAAEVRKKAPGFNQPQLSRLESGWRRTSLENVQALADVLGKSPAYLMSYEGMEEVAESDGDPRAALLESYAIPAGLRDLASKQDLQDVLKIQLEEWRALSTLAKAWPDAESIKRDGWLAILLTLRSQKG